MDCSKADEYLMKYMDNTLTEEEAKKLHAHLAVCEKCMADFTVYESLVTDFANTELIDAPDDLEARVMAEIAKLEAPHTNVNKSSNAIIAALGIGFFTTLALGFIMFVNRDLIFDLMAANPSFAPYVSVLTPVSDFVAGVTNNAWATVSSMGSYIFGAVLSYKYVILAAAVALLIAQIVLYNRSKSKNTAEAEAEE